MAEMGKGKLKGYHEFRKTSSLGNLVDRQKFDEFVGRSYEFLCAFAYQLLGDWDDAHDAVQNALLELWQTVTERLHQPNANALALTYQLVKSRALDIIRKRRKSLHEPPENPSPDNEGSDGESDEIDDEIDIEGIIIALEKREAIQRHGQELKGRAREVFLLLMEDRSRSEIARMLGISSARVSQLVREICLRLRQKLREEGWECNETLGVTLRF
ncbi:RNA polymerase sigma factor, sigma-70 family [Candidatus Fervidibacteria bacterium JGI MDM2 JNZ-1-D12]